MKNLQLIFALFLFLNCSAFGQTEVEETIEVEETTEKEDLNEWNRLITDQYEVEHPTNWTADTSGQMGTQFLLFSELISAKDQFSENVNLVIQDISTFDLTLAQFTEISENQIKSIITEGEILLSEQLEKDGVQYQKLIFTGKQGEFDLKFVQYYWVTGKEAYVLTLTCEADQFDQYQEEGERILNSFKLKE